MICLLKPELLRTVHWGMKEYIMGIPRVLVVDDQPDIYPHAQDCLTKSSL